MNNTSGLSEKNDAWYLKKYEDRWKSYVIPRLPKWIETYHLTWLTMLWSFLVVVSFYIGLDWSTALYFVPILVILQYFTDSLDGALGRYRDTGLVRWGFYVDHFLDYVFLFSLIFGYGFLIGFSAQLLILLFLLSAFMIHSFLCVGVTGKHEISMFGFGPSEGRLCFIVAHIVLINIDLNLLKQVPMFLNLILGVTLCVILGYSQNKFWTMDMDEKAKRCLQEKQ